MCRYAAVKGTNRGTVYLRCARASWDDRLVKYPRLPVRDCVGFARDVNSRPLARTVPCFTSQPAMTLVVTDPPA
jgi:hypothetical protein